jgi:hypothetical protein
MISSVSCALFVVKSVRPIVFNKNSSHLINSLDYVIDNINFEFVNNGNGIQLIAAFWPRGTSGWVKN